VTIRVEEMPSGKLDEYGQNWLGYKPTLIGESLQNLAPYLPCCWLPGVNLDQSYFEPMSTRPRHDIRDMLEKRKKYGKAGNFVQKTDQELQQQVRELTKLVQEMRRGAKMTRTPSRGKKTKMTWWTTRQSQESCETKTQVNDPLEYEQAT
jgi:hypothetical protein